MSAPNAPSEKDAAEQLQKLSLDLRGAQQVHQDVDLADLSAEQKESLKQTIASLTEAKVEAKFLPDEYEALRFCKAHHFDVAKTVEAYKKMVQWKKDHDFDTILTRQPPMGELFDLIIPYSLSGFAKNGEPLYIEKTGSVNTSYVHLIDTDTFIMNHVRGVERMREKMRQSSEKLGKRVGSVTSIIDLTGLSIGHRNAIHLLQAAAHFDAMYCPGLVGNVFVLNLPWFAPGLWDLVKMFLPISTLSKIHVLGANYKEELLKYIDADQLPVEYGGTAPSAVHIPTEDELKHVILRDKSGLQLTEQHVLAGEKFEIRLAGQSGDEFTWSFDVADQYDIGFSIDLLDDFNPDAKPVTLKHSSRVTGNKGAYTATGPCTLVFLWDNSYSYWNAKCVKYHASVAKKQ